MTTPDASRVVNALTVDVEDYYQVSAFAGAVDRQRWHTYESRVAANTDHVLQVLADAGVRATFFVLGYVAEREPGIVRRIVEAGHELASHGFGHELVYDLDPAAFREDLRRAKGLLETASGLPVRGYRAPSFSITPRSLWALDVLIEEGFSWDASVFPIRHDRYGIPTAPRFAVWVPHGAAARAGGPFETVPGDRMDAGAGLWEIPASTVRLGATNLPVGGGGYFRLLPYAWTSWGIRRLNRVERKPAVFYFHPWEVDPAQPRLEGPWLSRFRHYRNLDRTQARLQRLLAEFAFGPIEDTVLASARCP